MPSVSLGMIVLTLLPQWYHVTEAVSIEFSPLHQEPILQYSTKLLICHV